MYGTAMCGQLVWTAEMYLGWDCRLGPERTALPLPILQFKHTQPTMNGDHQSEEGIPRPSSPRLCSNGCGFFS